MLKILQRFLIIFFILILGFSFFVSIAAKQHSRTTLQIISPLSEIHENTNQVVTRIKQHVVVQTTPIKTPVKHPTPTNKPTISPSLTPTEKLLLPTPTDFIQEWGVAKQIDDNTWTMKIGEDERIGTPEEIFLALNLYRSRHGSNPLSWNDDLAQYAETRVDHYATIGQTDKHEGFMKFVEEPNNVRGLGFNALGENSSQGFKLNATHLIEWMYAGDEPHNKNQLNPEWTHVGIAVKDTFTELIFGGKKI